LNNNETLYIKEKFFNEKEKGLMLEVGAGHPDIYSVSKYFRDIGWRCIGFDPNPKFTEMHKNLGHEIYQMAIADYSGSSTFSIVHNNVSGEEDNMSYSSLDPRYNFHSDNLSVEKINCEVDTLNNFLKKNKIKKVDFISIDVEGWEIEVIKNFDCEKYGYPVFMIENYLNNPDYISFMESIGYSFDCHIEYNQIFFKDK